MRFLNQHHIPWLGALVESLFNSLPILSILNFLSVLVILYTNTRPYMDTYVPWLKLWMFIASLLVLILVVIVLVHKFLVPSLWGYRGNQLFRHERKIEEKLEEIIRRLNEEGNSKDQD